MLARIGLVALLIGVAAGDAPAQSTATGDDPATVLISPVPPKRSAAPAVDQPVPTIETRELAPLAPSEPADPAPEGTEPATESSREVRLVTPQPYEDVRERFRRVTGIADGDAPSVTEPAPGAPDGVPGEDPEAEQQRRFHRAPRRSADESAALLPAVPIDRPNTLLQPAARLRELDKMTGQTETFEVAVGETREFERLAVRLEACRAPEGNDTFGTMAFLKIWDRKRPGDEPVFSGWMFAESPALSALDHPRYDLWVISCTTSAGPRSAATE